MQSIFSNALSRAVAKHIGLSATRQETLSWLTLLHAARHDQPLAAGGLRGKRGADGLGAAAVLSVFPVCAA